MKDFKQIAKIACMAFAMLLLGNNIDAQVSVSNGGTYYVCCGSETTFEVDPGSGYWVANDTNWHWLNVANTCQSPYGCAFGGYTIDDISTQNTTQCSGYNSYNLAEVTAPSYVSAMIVSVLVEDCGSTSDHAFWITFTIEPYSTTIAGATNVCASSAVAETYTVTTNVPSPTNYAWTEPSCWTSGTCDNGSTCTTNTYTVTGACSPSNIQVTVTSGCPTSNTSNIGTLSVTSYSGVPSTPSGILNYQEYNSTCYYNADIPAVTGAEYYIWSKNTAFTSFYCGNTTSPITTGGPYYEGTAYTTYVKCSNTCGTSSSYGTYSKTTPTKSGCIQIREGKVDGQESDLGAAVYKIYPNPVSSMLTVEYPTSYGDNELTFSVYDMLGQKVVTWSLPASQNMVAENTDGLPVGLYLYVINSGDEILERGKLMIQR
jgi:type IX secretion system substrate protein